MLSTGKTGSRVSAQSLAWLQNLLGARARIVLLFVLSRSKAWSLSVHTTHCSVQHHLQVQVQQHLQVQVQSETKETQKKGQRRRRMAAMAMSNYKRRMQQQLMQKSESSNFNFNDQQQSTQSTGGSDQGCFTSSQPTTNFTNGEGGSPNGTKKWSCDADGVTINTKWFPSSSSTSR